MPSGKYNHSKIRGKKRPNHSLKLKELARQGKHPAQSKSKKWKKNQSISLKSKYKKGYINPMKGKKRPDVILRNKLMNQKGKNNGNYRHGYYCGENNPRNSKEYKLWRKSVFERDNYTCIWCGQIGGELHADHIKPFALFPELRFDIDNGRTLCKRCHMTTDTYLRGTKKRI